MPPKKKKGGKPKKKKEVDPEEQRRQDLLQTALSLQGEIEQESALEAQLATQTEVLRGYWEIEKKAREEKQRTLLEKEHRLRGIQDGHAIELGKYKRTVKELLFANQDELADKTTQSFLERRELSDKHRNEIGELDDELRDISNRIEAMNASHDKYAIAMRNDASDRATAWREQAGRRMLTLAAYAEEQYRRTRAESEKRLMEETKDLEGRNEATIQGAVEKNGEEVQRMRTEYSNVMNENLDTIATLRKEALLLREQDRHDRRALGELRGRNNDIVVPLECNRKDLTRLESDLMAFQTQKENLDSQKEKLRRAQEELKNIEWDHEVLFQKLEALELERDNLKEKARTTIHSAQQKANFDNLRLERKQKKLSMEGEKYTAAVAELLQRAEVDLSSLDQSQVRITDTVREKTEQVQALQQQLKSVKDAHTELLRKRRGLAGGGNR